MVFKFNSPRHFLSWVEGLHALGRSGSSTKAESESGDTNFSLSTSLEDGFSVIRQTKFDPHQTDLLQAKIAELKRRTMFSDEGHELEVPEYLAGSDKVWLKENTKRIPTRIIDTTLIINASYNANCRAEVTRKIGMAILTAIYRRNVIPRKLVVGFATNNARSGSKEPCFVAIDVSFNDLNGIAQILHPSSFRRMLFRIMEIYPDITYGYGAALAGATEKGYISIANIYGRWSDEKYFEEEIDKFLGVKSK